MQAFCGFIAQFRQKPYNNAQFKQSQRCTFASWETLSGSESVRITWSLNKAAFNPDLVCYLCFSCYFVQQLWEPTTLQKCVECTGTQVDIEIKIIFMVGQIISYFVISGHRVLLSIFKLFLFSTIKLDERRNLN